MVNGAQQATDQNSIPKVLLLTGTPPGTDGVGALFLRDLCASYPAGSMCCYAIVPSGYEHTPAKELAEMPLMVREGRREQVYNSIVCKTGKVIALLVSEYILRRHIQAKVDEIIAFAERNDVDMLWGVLDCPILIYIAEQLALKVNIPLVTQVWDIPEYLSATCAVNPWRKNNIMASFANVMKRSIRCGVISEPMAAEYQLKYGVDTVVLRPGLKTALLKKQQSIKGSQPDRFVIGFAGSFYAKDEWDALLNALKSVNWLLNGRKVIVRVLGSRLHVETKCPVNIEYFGWCSNEEIVDALTDVDVCYLPYWFDPLREVAVRLAFPGKLTTYLGVGKPVFFHGPAYASIPQFFKRFPAGVCCHSLSETEIINQMCFLVDDKDFYNDACVAANQAMEEELNMEVSRQRFAEMVGADVSILA